MIILVNTEQEIQADPRAMRKKYSTSILHSFDQNPYASPSF